MSLQFDDTIAALASAPGPAGEAIIRVSGPDSRATLESSFAPNDVTAFATARGASCHVGRVALREWQLDVPARVYFWPNARSYTGEPMAEIHTIGAPPLVEAILAQLHAHGARPARPGEFTLRAFLAGRIDLTQAEAVLGVIDAHDHVELSTALGQLAGGLSGPIGGIREDLMLLLADLEAELDFVEEDIEFVPHEQVMTRLASAYEVLVELQSQSLERMRTTGRSRVVLAGLPNAGKSTLFNALVGRNAALVSEVQGTTRDYLAAELDWNGLAIELIDTAGWDDVEEGIDGYAQRLRHEQFERADLVVWCRADDCDDVSRDSSLRAILAEQGTSTLFVTTKSDIQSSRSTSHELHVCAQTGQNVHQLVEAAVARLGATAQGARQMLGSTASRCRDSLNGCLKSLEAARDAASAGAGQEIISIEIRSALESLGAVLGTVYTDDILDRIFSRFCIGK